jgi:hypothetical protein
MNRNDDFDRQLGAWLRGQAPQQAPDRVLDAALERVEGESQKRGWVQRFVGGTPMTIMTRAAAVAAVVAIAALIGFQFNNLISNVGSSPSPSASLTPDASPSSPSPSEDGAASLVLRLMGGGVAGQVHLVTILDDGRVITSDPTGAIPPVERRLTAAGIQLVRDELDATGLTDTSADYYPVANPGVEPPGWGGASPSLVVGLPGGGTVHINWLLFGDTEQDYFQPQPEAEALDALAARLVTLDEWLPASAWADVTARPYEPTTYRILIQYQQWGGDVDDLPVESATVAWPLAGGIDAFGDVVTPSPDELRCGVATAEEGMAVTEALQAAGAPMGEQAYLAFELGDRATSRLVTITLEPIMPFGNASCGAATPF